MQSIRSCSAAYYTHWNRESYSALAVSAEREDMWLRIQGLSSPRHASVRKGKKNALQRNHSSASEYDGNQQLHSAYSNIFYQIVNLRDEIESNRDGDTHLKFVPIKLTPAASPDGFGGPQALSGKANALNLYSAGAYGNSYGVANNYGSLANPSFNGYGGGNMMGSKSASDAIFEELRYQTMELTASLRDKMGNTAVDYMFRNTKITQGRMQDIIASLKPQTAGGTSAYVEQHVKEEANLLQQKLLAQNLGRK